MPEIHDNMPEIARCKNDNLSLIWGALSIILFVTIDGQPKITEIVGPIFRAECGGFEPVI